jgi:AhpD family alkylhydroperoxidase
MSSTPRIKAIDPAMAKGKAKELLDAVVSKYGGAPNSFKTMAHSPAVLQGFLDLSGTLEGGVLPFETRYQIAIAVSELNGCPYCLSAFTAIGKSGGMKDETLAMCRTAGSTDPKIDAILKFAAAIVRKRGSVTDEDFEKVKSGLFGESGAIFRHWNCVGSHRRMTRLPQFGNLSHVGT